MFETRKVFAVFASILALVVAGSVFAAADHDKAPEHGDQKDAGHGDHKAPVYKAKVHIHGDKTEVERLFDFSKPEDRAAFMNFADHGELHELEVLKGPEFLFELASLRLDLGVYTIIVFGILMFVLNKYAWPNWIDGLSRREESIRSAIDDAKKARKEAENLQAELLGERNKAAEKVRAMLDEARKDAESAKADMITAARTEIQTERDRLKREIETETDQSLQKIWSLAASLATEASSKALKQELTGDAHKRLIDEALSDMRKAGAN